MVRRASIIAFIAAAGLALVRLSGCGAAKPSGSVGNWEETGSRPPKVMHIGSSSDDVYMVTLTTTSGNGHSYGLSRVQP